MKAGDFIRSRKMVLLIFQEGNNRKAPAGKPSRRGFVLVRFPVFPQVCKKGPGETSRFSAPAFRINHLLIFLK